MVELIISSERCKSCGYCVKYCPKNVLEIGKIVNEMGYPHVQAVREGDCIGCAMCAQVCPDAVFEVYR